MQERLIFAPTVERNLSDVNLLQQTTIHVVAGSVETNGIKALITHLTNLLKENVRYVAVFLWRFQAESKTDVQDIALGSVVLGHK